MMIKNRIAIFIPAYNAEKTLPIVLDRIPLGIKKKVEQIFIIDNSSIDDTYSTTISYKQKSGLNSIRIFNNRINRGYGGSQKQAYRYAIKKGFDIIIMLHGDAQYAPEKIPDLLEGLEKNKADMTFGSRMAGLPLKGGMPLHRFLGNKFLTKIQNLILNMNLTEFHSGFRAFRCRSLSQVPFELCSDDYHFDTEIIIQFKIKGLSIAEVPIPTHYGRERSYVNVISYGLNVIETMIQYWLWTKGIMRVKKFESVAKNYVKR